MQKESILEVPLEKKSNKKTIIELILIVSIVLLIIVLAYLIYNYSNKPVAPEMNETGNETPVIPNQTTTLPNQTSSTNITTNQTQKTTQQGGGGGGSGGTTPCTPNCAGKQCGDDGCGGSCGTCEDGFFCNQEYSCERSNIWYVRPSTEEYGMEDGSSYETAWDGLENINWSLVGPGDTLYVCGLHLRTRTGGSAWAVITPKSNGYNEGSRIIIRGDCQNDQGIIWGAGIMAHQNWTYEENNTWSITAVGTPNSQWYFEDITKDSWKVIKQTTSLEECMNTSGSFYSENYSVGTKLYVHTTDNLEPTGRIAANRLGYNLYVNNNSYITWKNIKFYGIYRWISYNYPPQGAYSFVDHMTWDNCTIWYGEFIHFLFRNFNHNIQFLNCDIGWASNGIGFAEYPIGSGSIGDSSEPKDVIIKGNKFHDIGVTYGTTDSHAISGQGSSNILIEDNEIYNTGTGVTFYCYHVNQSIKNITVTNNWIHDTHSNWGANSRGIELVGGAGQGPGTVGDVYGNIVGPNVSSVGYRYIWEEAGEFYNNICYDCGTSFEFSHHIYPVNVVMKNSISLSPRQSHLIYRCNDVLGSCSLDSDYNIFYPISGNQFFFYEYIEGGGGPDWGWKNFTQWQSLSRNGSTFDTHSIVADPLFVDAENGDFNLKSDSPAIDAGAIVPGYHCSTSGAHSGEKCKGWLGSAPDIGAYEYSGNIGETTAQVTEQEDLPSEGLISTILSWFRGFLTANTIKEITGYFLRIR